MPPHGEKADICALVNLARLSRLLAANTAIPIIDIMK